MVTTKCVLIVDDDKNIDRTTVHDYIQYMNREKGAWGNFSHPRAPALDSYKSWPSVGYSINEVAMAEQDYLSGMWFLEQTWLEYFMKERPPSLATSEDMHLSHVMRKYLNLNTYGGKGALKTIPLPNKAYVAAKGSALDLREFIFDHQLGRGNKMANVDAPLETLMYVEMVGDMEYVLGKLEACPWKENANMAASTYTDGNIMSSVHTDISQSWCQIGKTAVVFRGAKEQELKGLIKASERLCDLTGCTYFSVKPKIVHPIKYFDMREGYGQEDTGVEIPFADERLRHDDVARGHPQ